jgi:predicted N-acetyltransferase YhbS
VRLTVDAQTTSPDLQVRALGADDIDRLIAIDRAHTRQSRRRYFEKRLAAAKTHPDDVVHIGAERGGLLRGFAIARIQRGEFGGEHTVAVLDTLGVEPESQERGVGQTLMASLIDVLRRQGVRSVHTEAGWNDRGLLRYFEAAGFSLAPRLVLERSIAVPLDETLDEV